MLFITDYSPTPSQSSPTMLHLPQDVLSDILTFVKIDSFIIIGTVCSAFHASYNQSEKITRKSKFLQSPQLLEQAPHIEFKRPFPLDDLIARNEIDVIPLLLSRGLLEWDPFCVERAAEVNSYRFFQWLLATELAWLPEVAHFAAAETGNLELMIYLVDKGVRYPDHRSIVAAKAKGFRKTVEWLRELEIDGIYDMVRAARQDNVCAFEDNQMGLDVRYIEMYITEACSNSSFDVLEYFRRCVGIGPKAADVATARHFKHFEVVEWCAEFFPVLFVK